jgi:hypothetical protein
VVNPAAIFETDYLPIAASRSIAAAFVEKNALPFDLKGLLVG